jgi:uncharacterized protein YcfL
MKTFSTLSRAALAAGLLLTVTGCASVNTITPAESRTTPNRIADKRIITDNNVNRIAYVSEITESTVGGNLKHVQAKIQNLTAAGKNVDYRFQWYDASGMAIGDPVQHTAFLEGGQMTPIGETATSPNAVTWQLDLAESVGRIPGNF